MLTLFRWLSRWPLWLLHALGGALGWLSYVFSPTYRRRFDANAVQASVAPRLSRQAVAEAGRLLTELPYLWMRPHAKPLAGNAQIAVNEGIVGVDRQRPLKHLGSL